MSYSSGVNTVNEHFNYMATNSPMIVDELQGNITEAINSLRDFPQAIGAPNQPKAILKRNKKQYEDIDELLSELRGSYSEDNTLTTDLPTPKRIVTFDQCLEAVKLCDYHFKIQKKANLQYVFLYGHWIDKVYSLTKSTSSSLSFISWIEKHTLLKKTQAYCYRSFYKNFKDHRKILRSTLSFRWFNKHGTTLIKHFRTSKTLSMEWYSNTY